MNDGNKKVGFFSYIALTVILFVGVNFYYAPRIESIYFFDMFVYLCLMILVSSMPLKVGHRYIMLTLAISLMVFFEYGLVAELWLSQLSLLISLLMASERRSIRVIIINQSMYIWMSSLAGIIFYALGGKVGFKLAEISSQLLPICTYAGVYFIVNIIIIYLFREYSKSKDVNFLSEDLLWAIFTVIFTIPFAIIVFFIKADGTHYLAAIAIVLFLVSSYFSKLYHELRQSHKRISTLNEINIKFASELNLSKTIDAIQEAVRKLLSFDYSNIYIVEGDELKLISHENYFEGKVDYDKVDYLESIKTDGLLGTLVLNQNAQIIENDAEVYLVESGINYSKNCQSFISLPMVWYGQVTGVIILASNEEYNFSRKDIGILKIVASQAGVAIRNAMTYKLSEEKMLTDELTNIYNFRAFSIRLNELLISAEKTKEKVSILMIDLDHFKKINDTYGHEAGNFVLKEAANIFKKLTREIDIVSRYGGEEFSIILSNTDGHRANIIAERIRSVIANHVFKVKDNSNNEVNINVTASIGIATFPDMTNSSEELIRYADRALYVGSKQKGRNKVSMYSAESI